MAEVEKWKCQALDWRREKNFCFWRGARGGGEGQQTTHMRRILRIKRKQVFWITVLLFQQLKLQCFWALLKWVAVVVVAISNPFWLLTFGTLTLVIEYLVSCKFLITKSSEMCVVCHRHHSRKKVFAFNSMFLTSMGEGAGTLHKCNKLNATQSPMQKVHIPISKYT